MPPWVLALLEQYPWLPLALLLAAVRARSAAAGHPSYRDRAGDRRHRSAELCLYRLLRKLADGKRGSAQPAAGRPDAGSRRSTCRTAPISCSTLPARAFAPPSDRRDSPTAVRFKNALRDSFMIVTTTRTVSQRPAPVALDLNLRAPPQWSPASIRRSRFRDAGCRMISHSALDSRSDRRSLRRGHGLPQNRLADVPTAQGHLCPSCFCPIST